jgi:hypothetical protein
MRINPPKQQHDFLTKLEMREVQEALSLQLCRQRHKEIKTEISKFLGGIFKDE